MRRRKWMLAIVVILVLAAGITYRGRRIHAQMAERQVQVEKEDLERVQNNQSAILGDLRDIKSDLHDIENDLNLIKTDLREIKQALR